MSFQDYKNCMFEFIRINNCYRYGFYQGGSGSTTFQFQLNWVYVNNSGSDGMQLFGSNNVLLQVFSNLNLRDGIVLSGGYENVLIHPDVESNTRYGIWVINEHNDEIFAAAAGSNGSRGIYLYYSTDCKVIGGVFSSNTGSGIAVTSSGSVLARRNHIIEAQLTGNTRYGIEEADFGAGVPTQNVYKNNRISGNTEGPLLIVGTSNAYDQTPMAIALNLTGGATDIEVFHANAPCVLVGYTILYSVATGGGAGVNIRVGRYQDGVALDDDYFDISASELNKAKGYSKHFVTADLTQTVIAAGDTITVGTAGGKADTGEVILILKIAEMGD